MRRKLPLMLGALFLAFATGACEGPQGPEGPAGPMGPEGPEGPQGPQGPAGENAAETCSDCHTSNSTIVAVEAQYDRSGHGTSLTFERDSGPLSGGCNLCHTSQGFIAAVVDGTPLDDIAQPAPINCRTCHNIHMAMDSTDWSLVSTDPVTINVGGATVDAGNGNLCVNCHQARDDDLPDVDIAGGATVTTSRYWGPHYGSQSNTAVNSGYFDLPNTSTTQPTGGFGLHLDLGCTGCHMQEPYGAQAGGHTWWMSYNYHGGPHILNDGTCDACHSDVTTLYYGSDPTVDADGNPVVAGTADGTAEMRVAQLNEIADSLISMGLLTDVSHPASQDVTSEEAAAIANYQLLYHDGSYGVHYPGLYDAALANLLEWIYANTP